MSNVGGGISDIFGGIGDLAASASYFQAAGYAKKNSGYVKLSGAVQQEQLQRKNYEILGTTEAAAGANNLSLSGSAIDVLHSNAQQMSLQRSLTSLQTQIDVNGWLEKAAGDTGAGIASAAKGAGGIIGGIFKIFSDIRLKDIIACVGELEPGIGLYRFRYKGEMRIHVGVIAQEVLKVRPELVGVRAGYLTVDYGGLGYQMQ